MSSSVSLRLGAKGVNVLVLFGVGSGDFRAHRGRDREGAQCDRSLLPDAHNLGNERYLATSGRRVSLGYARRTDHFLKG